MIRSHQPVGQPQEGILVGPSEGASPAAHALLDTAAIFVVGVGVFAASYWVVQRLVPFSMYEAIDKKRNSAVAVIVLSLAIGLAIILAAALKPSA